MRKFISKFIAPLKNFKCNILPLKLSGKYTIREINDAENNHLHYLRTKANFMPHGNNEYVLETLVECDIEKEFDGEETKKNNQRGAKAIEDGITVMRLFKEGLIGFDCILRALSNENKPSYTAFYSHRYLTRITGEFSLYELKGKKELDLFTVFWKKYLDSIEEGNKAIHWFYKSFHEFYGDDRLLDLVIALENLYLKDDKEKQSLRYKFALRAACYLENSPQKRKELFDFLSDMYSLRNKIVHGDKIPEYDAIDILPKLEDIVRKSLSKILIEPAYYKRLEEHILGTVVDFKKN